MRFWMMVLLLSSAASCSLQPALAGGWTGTRPKLVVVMVIDQFRADYLVRFQKDLRKDGFQALIKGGAYYPTAEYDILQSMTGPGHATILTGAYPYQMGIPINEWYDQRRHAVAYCVDDPAVKTVGPVSASSQIKKEELSSSPKNLVGSTLGDELKNVDLPSRVFAIALKDRAAVLLGGKRADLALWMEESGWSTSTYYRPDGTLPSWVQELNQKHTPKEKCDGPCGVQATVNAALAALRAEKLGAGSGPDVLALSFSNHDITGHKVGPNAPEMKILTLAEDKAVADLRTELAKRVPGGLKNVVFVLTGDHGVAPVPEEVQPKGLDAGRIDEEALAKKINGELNEAFGRPQQGNWIKFVVDFNFYLDEQNMRDAKVNPAAMESAIKKTLLQEPGFAHVITQAEYEARVLPPGDFARRALKTFYPGRSGHVMGLQKPFYINAGKHKANHMTGYTYDRMVPLVLSGFGVKNGVYSEKAEVVDIAPTLAFLLGVIPPPLSEGRVLSEALTKGP